MWDQFPHAVPGRYMSDFELAFLEIDGGQVGVNSRFPKPGILFTARDAGPESYKYPVENISIHDLFIHDLGAEGIYFGNSNHHRGISSEIYGFRMYNVRVDNVGNDGLQIGSIRENGFVYDNHVSRFGEKNLNSHKEGIRLTAGNKLRVFRNLSENGPGAGIYVNPTDRTSTIYSNVMRNVRVGMSIRHGKNADADIPTYVFSNTIINAEDWALQIYKGKSKDIRFINNLIVGNDAIKSSGANPPVTRNNMSFGSLNVARVGENFIPLSGSPVIGAGENLTSYGVDIDYYNRSRPGPGGWTVGAAVAEQ